MANKPIRVLVVDDSAYIRKVVREMLERSPDIQVIGSARNGLEALELVEQLNPDVVTLDLIMPELDGVGFLRAQMPKQRIPVVVCSIASETGETAIQAIEAGALEFVQKPTALAIEQVYEITNNLIAKVKAAASVTPDKIPVPESIVPGERIPPRAAKGTVDAVLIGISTGGPQALRYMIPKFPKNFPVPLAIVLHMPVGYTGPFAAKLNDASALDVREASEGDVMQPGRALLAPAGLHLQLYKTRGQVLAHLDLNPSDTLHRPAVDVLFRSAAETYGSRVLAVVMTGMGNDGTAGAAWVKAHGGLVFTEAEESCIVYGMPRSVVEAGLGDKSIPLEKMAEAIVETV